MLFLRDVRSYAKVEPAVFKVRVAAPQRTCTRWVAVHLIGSNFPCLLSAPQAQGRLGELLDGGKPVRAVRLGVPRSDGVSALMWLLAVAANDDIPPVVTDDINPFEAYALAAILGP